MKTFIAMLLLSVTIHAKTIKEDNQEYTCTVKKPCDEQLKAARAQIALLKKQLKEQKPEIQIEEFTQIQHHIVSLLLVRDLADVSTTTTATSSKADVSVKYVPSLSYQYQFDNGLTPLIGSTSKGHLFGGLGFEF